MGWRPWGQTRAERLEMLRRETRARWRRRITVAALAVVLTVLLLLILDLLGVRVSFNLGVLMRPR